ncbi:hypothetical protein P3T76_004411 [Phytophthora citrophthora]|uniref:Uncharacterized protein n=1 Tax=Phytophthora citrophthora TaxID=4793 RepID=A0AAD9LRV2_9STRA|nr:hypothetical protein P3T76_004411 [Phytophthora citrophthora]
MAFYAGREDAKGWQDDGWESEVDERELEDALFSSLDEEQEEAVLDDPMADLFSMKTVDADTMQLNLVERLSWDATSEASGDEEEIALQLALPEPLPIQVSASPSGTGDSSLQWGLISPCSETESPRPSINATLSPLTRVSISSPVRQLRFFEPEHEPTVEQIKAKKEDAEQVVDEEDEETDEEVKPFDPETCWSPDTNSVLSSPTTKVSSNPFPTYQPTEYEETYSVGNDIISDSDSDGENQQHSASALRPSLLPRVPSIAQWRRQKARTCSGAGSAGMPTALSLATFKARTRSLSRSRNQSGDYEDDGDFSSDDEGYTPELHHRRASETEPFGASQWRRTRHSSINFKNHRLSVNVSMSPAIMTKRLQDAKSKLNNGLHLLRSGSSASTATSEESFLDSPLCEEIKSAPAGVHREPSIFSDAATSTSLISAASVYSIDTSPVKQPTRQQQLRAGVFKAAGLLNAASAEAARKLKTRSFRAPHLPRPKAASETEEEDPELSTSCAP